LLLYLLIDIIGCKRSSEGLSSFLASATLKLTELPLHLII